MAAFPQTIKNRSDFVRIGKFGARAKTELLSVICFKTGLDGGVGYTASRKVGTAVVRNKAKRRFRSLVQKFRDRFVRGYSFVFIANRNTAEYSFADLERDFLYCIRRSVKRAKENESCC